MFDGLFNPTMNFLVYRVNLSGDNASLGAYGHGVDQDIDLMVDHLDEMDLKRVVDNKTVRLLVDEIEHNKSSGTITADVYKQANPSKALHQLEQDGQETTIQEVLSEQEDAFLKGLIGVRKVDGELYAVVEKEFGSYFGSAAKGFDLESQYSGESIKSIQNSETIGKTVIEFDDDYDLTASLFQPPEDKELREDDGFGKVDLKNKVLAAMKISRSHTMTLDIDRDEWIDNMDMFNELVDSDIITRIKIRGTKDQTVKIGEGGDRAIRETVSVAGDGSHAVNEAFKKLAQ